MAKSPNIPAVRDGDPDSLKKHIEAWQAVDLTIERSGEKIILPETPTPMALRAGAKALIRAAEEEERIYSISEQVTQVHFFDGLVAFGLALKDKFGYAETTHDTMDTWFGKMKIPPKLINVRIGPGPKDVIQVPFGVFTFPGVTGEFQTAYTTFKGMPVLSISGEVKSNERFIILDIIEKTKEMARTRSIYRANSIILDSTDTGEVNLDDPLDFFDPTIGFEVPIFNDDTQALIDTALLAPLQFSDNCRKLKIPLKRGVLLEGPYGTGKTLTAKQVAKVANENGWTFILVKQSTSLKFALDFAKMYQPAVVFAEDIDRIAGNRNEGANTLINEIDGILGKNDEIITVLTTNFAGSIDKAFLRPGRLDTVVSITPPEADAVKRLIRFYAGELLDNTADLETTAEGLAGNIPATIREVVERSKLAMLVKGGKQITAKDLEVATLSLTNHLKLINDAKEGTRSLPAIEAVIGDIVRQVFKEKLNR